MQLMDMCYVCMCVGVLKQSAIMGYSQTSEAHTPGGQPEIKRVNNLSSALPQESGRHEYLCTSS